MKSTQIRKRRSSRHNKDLTTSNKSKKRKIKVLGFGSAFMLLLAVSTTSLLVSAQGSEAAPCELNNTCDVPEISALEGTAAIAAVLAMLLLAWERRRQA